MLEVPLKLLKVILYNEKVYKIFFSDKKLSELVFRSLVETEIYLPETIKFTLEKIYPSIKEEKVSSNIYIKSLGSLTTSLLKQNKIKLCEGSIKCISAICDFLLLEEKEKLSHSKLCLHLFLLMTNHSSESQSKESISLLKKILSFKTLFAQNDLPLETFVGNFILILTACEGKELQELISLFIDSGLYKKLESSSQIKFWNALSQQLSLTPIDTFPSEIFNEILKLFLGNAKNILDDITKEIGVPLAKSLAKIAVEGFFKQQQEAISLFNELKKGIFIEPIAEDKFPLGLSLCQELNEKLNLMLDSPSSGIQPKVLIYLLQMLHLFLEKKQHHEHITPLFSDVLSRECSREKNTYLPLIKKIYQLGTQKNIFDEKKIQQSFIHAAYKNCCGDLPIVNDKEQFPVIKNFLEHLVKKSHSSKLNRLILLLNDYRNLPSTSLLPLYKGLLLRIEKIDFKDKEKLYQEIFNNLKHCDDDLFFSFSKDFIPAFFIHLKYCYKPWMKKMTPTQEEVISLEKYLARIYDFIDFAINEKLSFSKNYEILYPIFQHYFNIAGDVLQYIVENEAAITKHMPQWEHREKLTFRVPVLLFREETPKDFLEKRNTLLLHWMNKMLSIKTTNKLFSFNIKTLLNILAEKHVFNTKSQVFSNIKKRINSINLNGISMKKEGLLFLDKEEEKDHTVIIENKNPSRNQRNNPYTPILIRLIVSGFKWVYGGFKYLFS